MTFSDSNSNEPQLLELDDKDMRSAFHSQIKEHLQSIDEAEEINYQSKSSKDRDYTNNSTH